MTLPHLTQRALDTFQAPGHTAHDPRKRCLALTMDCPSDHPQPSSSGPTHLPQSQPTPSSTPSSTTPAAKRMRQYRQRAAEGKPIRHPATKEEKAALLATPYGRLDDKQRRRARRYEREAQQQAQLVASRFPPIGSSSSPTQSISPIPSLSPLLPAPAAASTAIILAQPQPHLASSSPVTLATVGSHRQQPYGPYHTPYLPIGQSQQPLYQSIPVAMVPFQLLPAFMAQAAATSYTMAPAHPPPHMTPYQTWNEPAPSTVHHPPSIMTQPEVDVPMSPSSETSGASITHANILATMPLHRTTPDGGALPPTSTPHTSTPPAPAVAPIHHQSVVPVAEPLSPTQTDTSDDLSTLSIPYPLPHSMPPLPDTGPNPYLVHHVKHACEQTVEDWKIHSPPPPLQSSTVDPRQYQSFESALFDLVLKPKKRYKHKHMHHITHRGHYLNVWDVDAKEDDKDVFTEIRASPPPTTSSAPTSSSTPPTPTTPTSSSASTTSSAQMSLRRSARSHPPSASLTAATTATTTSVIPTLSVPEQAQALLQIIPPETDTHVQVAYNHVLTESKSPSGPVYTTTTFSKEKMVDAYTNLIHASDLVPSTLSNLDSVTELKWSPSQHTFVPSIQTQSIQNASVQQHLRSVGTEVQQFYQHHVPPLHYEILCDHVFVPPLDGFGVNGVQIYFKHGICVSWLHDEILWMAALNYMMKSSIGVALWIAIGVNDYKQTKSLMDIHDLLMRPKMNIMDVGKLLDTLIQSNTRIEYVFQRPGQLVSSPPGIGAAHLVIADGLFMSQLAWNTSFTGDGAIQCLSFWGEHQTNRDFGHLSLDNSSMATRTVLPLYTMEENGYTLGLMDKLNRYKEWFKKLHAAKNGKVQIEYLRDVTQIYCPRCLHRQDWVRVNGRCVHCYFKHPHIAKLISQWSLPSPALAPTSNPSPSTRAK